MHAKNRIGSVARKIFGHPGTRLVLIFFLLLVAFFLSRAIPCQKASFRTEDGIFAVMVLDAPQGPNYGQVARIGGVEEYITLSHPAPLYEWLRLTGHPMSRALGIQRTEDSQPWFRLLFSFYQLAFWLLLLAFLFRYRRADNWSIAVLFALVVCPIAVRHSLEMQLDNSSGSIIFFLVFLFVLFFKHPFFSFLGGLVVSMGKNEWSIVFAAAIVLSSVTCLFLKRSRPSHFATIPALVFGLALGNLLSWWMDPFNYLQGFKLIPMRGEAHGYLSSAILSLDMVSHSLELFTEIYPHLFLFGIATYCICRKFADKELHFAEMFAYVVTSGLLFGFLLDGTHNQSRYYIPVFVGLVVFFFYLYPTIKSRIHKQTMALAVLLLVLHSMVFQWQTFTQKDRAHYVANKKPCVRFGDCYGYIEEAEYMCKTVSRAWAQKTAKAHGVKICR